MTATMNLILMFLKQYNLQFHVKVVSTYYFPYYFPWVKNLKFLDCLFLVKKNKPRRDVLEYS